MYYYITVVLVFLFYFWTIALWVSVVIFYKKINKKKKKCEERNYKKEKDKDENWERKRSEIFCCIGQSEISIHSSNICAVLAGQSGFFLFLPPFSTLLPYYPFFLFTFLPSFHITISTKVINSSAPNLLGIKTHSKKSLLFSFFKYCLYLLINMILNIIYFIFLEIR